MDFRSADSLRARNEKFAVECVRLKRENRTLKILVRKLLTEELKITSEEKIDVSTQTDKDVAVISPSNIENDHYQQNSNFNSSSVNKVSNQSFMRSPIRSDHSSKLPILAQRLEFLMLSPCNFGKLNIYESDIVSSTPEKSDRERKFGTPLSLSGTIRSQRTVRRVVSYKEPSGTSKLRKSYCPIKFTAEV